MIFCVCSEHLSDICPMALLPCKWCDELITRENITTHENNRCSNRIVTCRNEGCSNEIIIMQRQIHEEKRCAHRSVACKNVGCPVVCIPSSLGKIEEATRQLSILIYFLTFNFSILWILLLLLFIFFYFFLFFFFFL